MYLEEGSSLSAVEQDGEDGEKPQGGTLRRLDLALDVQQLYMIHWLVAQEDFRESYYRCVGRARCLSGNALLPTLTGPSTYVFFCRIFLKMETDPAFESLFMQLNTRQCVYGKLVHILYMSVLV